jgi:hypothetical protein
MLSLGYKCTQLVAPCTVLATLRHIMIRAERDSKLVNAGYVLRISVFYGISPNMFFAA